jgi:hypothetical protein
MYYLGATYDSVGGQKERGWIVCWTAAEEDVGGCGRRRCKPQPLSIIVSASSTMDSSFHPRRAKDPRSRSGHVDCPKATQHAIHSVVNHDLIPARAMAPDEPPISAPTALPTMLMPCATPPSSSSVPIVVIVFFDCCISNINEPPPPPPPLLLRCPQSCRRHF